MKSEEARARARDPWTGLIKDALEGVGEMPLAAEDGYAAQLSDRATRQIDVWRRSLRVAGGFGVDEAILRRQLQVLSTRDQTVESPVHQPLRDLASRVPEPATPRWLGNDPDFRPVVLGGDAPGAVVSGADAGFTEESGLGFLVCVRHRRREAA